VDPARSILGDIVYPSGVKPAPNTETLQNGEVVKATDSSASGAIPKTKSKTKTRHKSSQ
jgi:hypothetical protein